MTAPPVTPDVRADILRTLSRVCEVWLNELMNGFFEHPDSAFAKQLVLEAFSTALARTAGNTPEGRAVMQTFVLELQDLLNEKEVK